MGETSPLVSGNCIGKAVGVSLQESLWDQKQRVRGRTGLSVLQGRSQPSACVP